MGNINALLKNCLSPSRGS